MEYIIRKIDERILYILKKQNTNNYKEAEYRIEELIHLKGIISDAICDL